MRGRKRETALGWGILLVVLSVLYVALLTGKNPEVFLIDDNRTQWYPVMERAYEDFWTTGKIYCYDFYQMKGMSVAGQGYYGVMNPFILLSYTAAKLLPGGMDAITCYIGIMVVLGNLFFYLVCRRLSCKEPLAFLMTLTYSTMGCFWAFFYWYYVFNNYFLVPLLVYVFLRCTQKGWLSCWACGIVLAMDLWMGNVQYTFYHYLLFGILCLVMIILKNGRYIKILLANAAVGVALSLPMFFLLLQTSGGFQRRGDFMKYPLLYFSLLLHSVIPQGILRQHGDGFSLLDSFVMGRDDNLVCYMGAVGILLFAALVWAAARFWKWVRESGDKSGAGLQTGTLARLRGMKAACRAGYGRALFWSHEKKTVAGCTAALLFYLSLMSGGLAAQVLYITPVISGFRYLFKAIFPAAPLAVMLLAYLIGAADREDSAESGKDSVAAAGSRAVGCGTRRCRPAILLFVAVYACVGVVNAHDTVKQVYGLFDMRIEGTFAQEKETAVSALKTAGADYKNYRTAAFLRFPGVNDECFDISRNLTKNFATSVGAFSLAGYEIAMPESRLRMFDAVYSDTDFYTRYAGADTLENFCRNLWEESEKVQRQLIENGVRYLLLDKTTLAENRLAQEKAEFIDLKDYREEVVAALQKLPDIHVERITSFNEYYDLVELAGTNSLCMDGEGGMVPLTDENMQTLSFPAKAAGDYTLSFAWDSHLQAFVTEADGTVRMLPAEETENGNIRISTAGSAGGQVTLSWHDPLCTAGFIWEGVTMFAFMGLLIALAFLGNKCYSNIHKTD